MGLTVTPKGDDNGSIPMLNGMDYATYAKNLTSNSNLPDQTTTVEQKREAIALKKKLLAHPGCPSETASELKSEIATLESEIRRMSSIFS